MTGTITTVESTARGTDEPLVVVTCDSHVSPTLDEHLRAYCPAKYRQAYDDWLAATVAARAATQQGFVFGGDESDPEVERIHTWNLQTQGHRDMSARLRDMNRDGVAAEVIFHGSAPFEPLPFTSPGISGSIDEPEVAAAGQHMYNAWLADFCTEEPERHAGLAQLPMWDIDLAMKELRWARNAGLKGVNFSSARREITPYEDPAWEPFWAACEDFDMPLANHGGAAVTPPVTGPTGLYIYMMEAAMVSRVSPLVRLVFGGVFERHPKLKLVQTERPGNWYGATLKELDSMWITFGYAIQPMCPKPPSEYCHDQYFWGASFPAHFEAKAAVREGYASNVLWGSDYPHPEGTYHYQENPDDTPITQLAMQATYAGLPHDEVRGMLGENAVRVYGLDDAKLRTVAAGINAPTLAQISEPLAERPNHWGLAFRTEWTHH